MLLTSASIIELKKNVYRKMWLQRINERMLLLLLNSHTWRWRGAAVMMRVDDDDVWNLKHSWTCAVFLYLRSGQLIMSKVKIKTLQVLYENGNTGALFYCYCQGHIHTYIWDGANAGSMKILDKITINYYDIVVIKRFNVIFQPFI